ncbi:TonB-dependent receptor [Hirschia maritima]|uniref:TonB-dependent receptor n=1 Tax=Hirschia maritima TaxID=1121961 RepID=UPI00037DAF15|nr:TonB-dependent receptor [Hirschia maritima]
MNNREKFKFRLLAGAATGTLFLTGVPALAQETQPATTEVADDQKVLDVITVTGIKSSIANALATKKQSNSIVEAISAEDIGKLPDLSIADSLARLPGVTAQRVRGRSQQVSIRGLGPDFSLALWNGREVVSAGNNRGVEFDQFPSELVSKGVVYKTPDATLAATGIAGAVDLQTVRPLDHSERKINLSGKYVLNDSGSLNPDFDDNGYRLFGSYIDQNEDGTVGWTIAATHQSNPTHFTSRELKTNSGQTSIDPATGLVYPSDNPRTGVQSREFERTSVAGALQFEPTDRWQATIDAFYTDTEDAGIFRGVETPIASWSTADFQGTTGTSGFADTATYDDVTTFLRTDTEGNTAEIFAVGFNTSYEVTDNLTLTGDLAHSTLERNDIDYESYAGTGFAGAGPTDTLTFGFAEDGQYNIDAGLDYTDPGVVVLTDPGGWGQVGFLKEPKIDDELNQVRLEAEYAFDQGLISSIETGYLYTDREKNFDSNEHFIRAGANFVNGQFAIPTNTIEGNTDTGSIGLNIIAYNPASFLTDGTYQLQKATFDTEWTVEEEIHTFYAMANIEGDLGSIPMRGNVGFQYQDVEQSSTATLQGGGQRTQTLGASNNYFLPSANISFEVSPDTFLRFAAAQTVTRPRLDNLAANQSVSINNQVCADTDGDFVPDSLNGFTLPTNACFNIGGGNPQLEPYKSTSFDVSFEKYFSTASAFSVAVFHKELSDWVENATRTLDITEQLTSIGIPALDAFIAANPEVATAVTNFPENISDGTITGIEATLRMSMDDFLPAAFEGFGFNASYTYADSSLSGAISGDDIRIPGYSDKVWSGDIYYENHGWRARVSARHRSGFLSEVPQFDGSLTGAEAQDETIVDLQLGYEWDDGKLDGLGINFEVFNLTDEPFVTEAVTTDANVTFPSRYEQYGTTYNLTVSKSF